MKRALYPAAVAALFAVHALLGIQTIRANAPTYDEPVHLAAGYSYWKTGDYMLNGFFHPPFEEMWAAVPLLFMNPSLPLSHPFWAMCPAYQYPFSDIFLYHNRYPAGRMLGLGRGMVLLLSLALGLFIFLWSKELFGPAAALAAAVMWAFLPAFIANGTLVTTDMAVTLFYFSTMYFAWKGKKVPAGLSLGLLLASKFSSVAIFASLALVLIWMARVEKTRPSKLAKDWALSGAVALLVLWAVYQFAPLTGYYYEGLRNTLGGIMRGRSTFMMGSYSTSGWLWYFPVVFLLKTPLPLLLLLAAAFLSPGTRERRVMIFVLLPALVYFGLSCVSKVQIGHRHILPVYPFLILLASGALAAGAPRWMKGACAALLIWNAVGTLRAHPYHIAYFNELIGNPDNGYKYLTDSNLDWGQGLKELGTYLRSEGINGIYLNYFGTADPHYYGIRYVPFGFVDTISDTPSTARARGLRAGDAVDFTKEKRVLFAVSATNLQATYYGDKEVFSFLKGIEPEKLIARSIFVYDMSAHPAEYAKLKELMKR